MRPALSSIGFWPAFWNQCGARALDLLVFLNVFSIAEGSCNDCFVCVFEGDVCFISIYPCINSYLYFIVEAEYMVFMIKLYKISMPSSFSLNKWHLLIRTRCCTVFGMAVSPTSLFHSFVPQFYYLVFHELPQI